MMNFNSDENTNEYIETAHQIFDYFGADSSSSLHVDELLHKFAPFMKTDKTEYSYLKSLLDPDETNPKITVSELASTLNQYSETRKGKVDLDESFNFKAEQVPHDSDSGISTDGFQILEELQCDLRQKCQKVEQLRAQLDTASVQHEEAVATMTEELASLKSQINSLREENQALAYVKHDYEEASERLEQSERFLEEARRELDVQRRRATRLAGQLAATEREKSSLQDLLTKSKEECHRINEMYASRQSTLREENETLKTEHADLSARMQDQEQFMQKMIKEKVMLEMELKDVLNKSNHNITNFRLDRSIDVSYTEDQMLTALDSLNADSKFAPENPLLDDESFLNALKEDQGRFTNISLFDEIRHSFYNKSKMNLSELNCTEFFEKRYADFDISYIAVATQTDEINFNVLNGTDDICNQLDSVKSVHNLFDSETQTCALEDLFDDFKNNLTTENKGSQTTDVITSVTEIDNQEHKALNYIEMKEVACNTLTQILEVFRNVEVMNFGTQTDVNDIKSFENNNIIKSCIDCTSCLECYKYKKRASDLENDLKNSRAIITEMETVLECYEENLDNLKKKVKDGDIRNEFLKSVADDLKCKLHQLQVACEEQCKKIFEMDKQCESAGVQTEIDQSTVSTQADIPCVDCVKRNSRSIKRYLWEPLKCLFQLFAVMCFLCAISVLYQVTRRWPSPCREPLPWRWINPQDLMDFFLRIEYAADVPM